jgi:DNA polymerase I
MSSDHPIERLLNVLEDVEEQHDGSFKALCPAHDDHNPSLDLKEVGENGQKKVLLSCRAGCETAAVLEKVGLEFKDLFSSNGAKSNDGARSSGRIVATYDYTEAAGNLLYQAVRYEPKGFSQRRPDGNGGWEWNLKGVEPVLYSLPSVLEARLKGETIYVLEGEKDVDRARKELGITATTCAMGAGKWRDSYSYTLAGADVVLIPDNDEAGRKHVLKVAENLLGVAKSVKILDLPDLSENGDLSDWLDTGGTTVGFERLSSQSQPYISSGDGDDLFGAVRFADLGAPKPREFIVEDIIPKEHPCLLHGGGGSAKSILADLAGICISGGRKDFLGHEILCHGPALIIDFELEVEEQHRRIMALCGGLGIALPKDLYYLSGLAMNTNEVFERAVKMSEKHSVLFAVIDSIGFAMRGDMESAKDVNAFYTDYVDPLRAIGVTPLIIDHQSRLQAGQSYKHKGAFGSVFKENRARSILQVEAVENDRDAGILKVHIRHKKANFSARLEPFGVELRFGAERIAVNAFELTNADIASEETLSATERIRLALKDGDKTSEEISEYTGLSRSYLQNILPGLERDGTVRVVKTEGRTKTYGLPEPPDDEGPDDSGPDADEGKLTENGKPPAENSDESGVESSAGSSTAGSSETLSSPSPSLYRSGNGDDTDEGGAEPHPGGEVGQQHHPDLITSDEDSQALIYDLAGHEIIAVDIETYPREKALDPRNGSIRLISIATERLRKAVDLSKVDPAPLLDALKTKTLVFFNGKFDLSFLKNRFGYEHEGELRDMMLMYLLDYFAQGERVEMNDRRYLEDPDETKGISSLAYVAKLYLGETLDKSEQDSDWSAPNLSEEQIAYALKDAEILLPLMKTLEKRLSELGILELADHCEHRALPGITWAENNGMPFDEEAWLRLAGENAKEAERLKEDIDNYAPGHPEGKSWNWNSRPQTLKALELFGFDTSKLPKTDKGNPSVGEPALKSIMAPRQAREFAQAILRYRAVGKLVSTYGEKWVKPAEPTDHERVVGGRAHTSYRQIVSTGRMASRKPNLQNLPRDERFRKCFRATDGRCLVVADYAQIELLFGAIVSGDETMLEALRNGEDLHLKTARALIGGRKVSETELKEYRKRAKAVNFGFLYGMGAKKFVDHAKNKFDLEVTIQEAERYKEAFFETYPGIREWHRRVGEACKRGEDVAFSLLGRPRKIGLKRSKYTGRYEPVFTEATNHMVQGSAADALKLTIARLWETRDECSGDPLLVGMIHDEIILEVDEGHSEEATDWLMRCMSEAVKEVTGDPETPVVVDVETRKSWGGSA